MKEKKPRILFSTPVLKHPPTGGPFLRIENTIKALSQISDLYIYSRVALDKSGYEFYRSLCSEFYFSPFVTRKKGFGTFIKRIINLISRKVIKRNVFDMSTESDSAYKDLIKVADDIDADLIWLGYGNISYPLLRYIKSNSNYKVILDTDSVFSRYILRELPFADNEGDHQRIEKKGIEKQSEESWGTKIADVTTAVSEVDAKYYRSLAERTEQIHIFSNVIDIDSYNKQPTPPKDIKKPYVYLAGTFWTNSPMDDAARWTIKEVLPLVRNKIPNVHLYIIGMGSSTILSDINDPAITITGELPSVLPYLCHADVALVPLRFESGTRFKILEAGACYVPIVSTTLGAEGIPITNDKDIIIADEPAEFANGIIKLINDRKFSGSLTNDLHRLIAEKNSISSLVNQGNQIIDYLMAD